MPETALMTLEEYAALEEPDEAWVSELVRGTVVREPRPGSPHGVLQVELAYRLRRWAENSGARVTAESGYVLSEAPPTVRGPDLAVVLDAGRVGTGPADWTDGAPDVAVEILSPSDRSTDIHAKTLEYLEAGARLLWIVDPATRSVVVHRPDGSAQLLAGDAVLDGEGVLPGFALPLSDLFATLDP